MFKANVIITLRTSILDPQGKAVEHAIGSLHLGTVTDVRIGKYVEFNVEAADEASARETADAVCRKLLANPVMEDYRFTVERV